MSDILDWRGNPLVIGRPVLYPRQMGHFVEMQEGILEAITPVERQRYNHETREYEPHTAYKFRILPTAGSRFGARRDERPVTISVGNNVTAITGA